MKKILLLISALAAFFSFLILFTQDYSSIFYPDETSAYQNTSQAQQQVQIAEDYDYALDTDVSVIVWYGKFQKMEMGHQGRIDFLSGGVYVENGQIHGGEFVLDMNSIVDSEQTSLLVQHLKSDDFFATSRYPYTHFRLRSFEHMEGDIYQAHGILTMKGISHDIVFPVTLRQEDDTYLASASFSIDRTNWNVTYGSSGFFENLGEWVIDDEIEISFQLVANKK